jgi:hypothetical protein
MFIIDFFANIRLGWLIRLEYILMAFFIVGAITSQVGKPLKVKARNYSTICAVLTFFFFRGVITVNAQATNDGHSLITFFNNDFFRAVFYAVLVGVLLRRLIKTCRSERIRKQRLFEIIMHRQHG